MLSDNKLITGIIGIGAFVIGGLMARQTAIEGLEVFDETVDKFKHRNDDKYVDAVSAPTPKPPAPRPPLESPLG